LVVFVSVAFAFLVDPVSVFTVLGLDAFFAVGFLAGVSTTTVFLTASTTVTVTVSANGSGTGITFCSTTGSATGVTFCSTTGAGVFSTTGGKF
jgi:hypothetical protein